MFSPALGIIRLLNFCHVNDYFPNFPNFFSDNLLLVCRNATDLYRKATFLSVDFAFYIFTAFIFWFLFVVSLEFSIYKIMSSENKDNFTSSFMNYPHFIYFSCLNYSS